MFQDLEHKLDMSNDRCRQMVEDWREEKENMVNQHKKDINLLKVFIPLHLQRKWKLLFYNPYIFPTHGMV